MINIQNIRNVSIIAHVDHGKSTLADRLIQICDGIPLKQMRDQVLDSMDLERERGITIKAQSVSLKKIYKGITYQLNFIDTPGHADFSYEVSRSLRACEAVLLLIDAVEGVRAQTLEHLQVAIDYGLKVIVVINKIDLPNADVKARKQEIINIPNIGSPHIMCCSAKSGYGVAEIISHIIEKVPHPIGCKTNPLQVQVLDSWFDKYLGVMSLVKVCNGTLKMNDKIEVISTKQHYKVGILGIFTPYKHKLEQLSAGQVGFLCIGVKNVYACRVGDTITNSSFPKAKALSGFYKPKPQVFSCVFPVLGSDFKLLKNALEKLKLNDASFKVSEITSNSLGSGFQCGFLGVLHMDIIRERLSREYKADLIITPPTVEYLCILKNGDSVQLHKTEDVPNQVLIDHIEEGFSRVTIYTPTQHVGAIQLLCQEKRGEFIAIDIKLNQAKLSFSMPFIEVIKDLGEKIKEISSGFGKIEYLQPTYRRSDITTLNIKINDELIDALSCLVHRSDILRMGRQITQTLKSELPRSVYATKIQAFMNSKVIAREDISALRKDVTAKCYGGDVTRKNKLLKKQKAGKSYRSGFYKVSIPKSVFHKLVQK